MSLPAVAVARRRLGDALFHRVAGDEGPRRRERIHTTPGPRWYAEDSAIRRVHGDASMFVGGMRAVLLQSLHPLAMQAVADHSGYRGDLWGRLARTSAFLATTTFATASDAQAAVDAVRRIHGRITGTMPDGTPYAASDPHLLRWVHVAEIDSFLRAHQRYGAQPLDAAGRDAYVDEAALVAERLGADDVPHSERELAEAIERFRPELRATDAAREAIGWLVEHPDLPRTAMPGYRLIVAAANELLPPWASEELGLRRHPLLDRTVVPAAGHLVTRTIRWAMAPPPELLEQARQAAAAPASPTP